MNMGGDHGQQPAEQSTEQSAEQVTFVYEPTLGDYTKAVRRFTFGTWPGIRGQIVLVAFSLGISWLLPTLKGFSPAVTAFVMACAVVAVLVVLPRVLARTAQEQYADMEEYGACRTVVREDRLTTTGAGTGTATGRGGGGELSGDIEWRVFPWYFETDEFFAVKTKNTRGVFVLPKRGAQEPADVDRVRALFDRNLRRI
ncbi:YcxB family protein [Streptomyces sp. NRRL F-2580]|uniref:YcxB family protein n=1 Tax=Streptomyces sp. NRRL F-2580 TaxID=1463841 RepID=UPI00131B0BDA|nr:YcxB family protein [Streptomyces sp. NRRL F-2580]